MAQEEASPTSTGTPSEIDLPTTFPAHTCLRRGLCPVTKLRAQGPEVLESHSLYYEQHGPRDVTVDSMPEYKHKVVFIMGLNSSSFAWGQQIKHFGTGGKGGGYTALAFDNRGVGNSGYPRGPYTTSGMAEDVICLLDYLGWTGERELNIVGISLGGMIAQELAYRIPHRISSLVLAVTTPGGHAWNNLPPWKGVSSLSKLLFTPDPVKKIPTALAMIYPVEWLDKQAGGDPKGRTNREIQAEGFLYRTNTTKPQQLMGHISQMSAGLTHYMSPCRLAFIAHNIPKIIVATGDNDHLVRPEGSRRIVQGMRGAAPGDKLDNGSAKDTGVDVELIEWEGTGHGIHIQREEMFNALIERCVEEGERKVREGYVGRNQ